MRRVAAVAALALAAPAAAFAASPVTGSIFGPVTAVRGGTFELSSSLSPTGHAKVSVSSSTAITEQATAPRSSLEVGACVAATGSRNAKGVVAADRITLSSAVEGQCTNGFGRRPGGNRPPGARRPGTGTTPQRPPGGFAGAGNFGFAFGKVTAIKGSTLTVSGTRGTTKVTTTVSVSSKTRLEETRKVGASAVTTKLCAFVNGTSTDKGVTVEAQRVALTPKVNGACNAGFRRPGANG